MMYDNYPKYVRNMTTGKYLRAIVNGKPKWTSDKNKALTMQETKDIIDMLWDSSVSRDEWIVEAVTS